MRVSMFCSLLMVLASASVFGADKFVVTEPAIEVRPAAGPGAKVPLETVKGGDPTKAHSPVAPSPVAVFEIDNELFGKLVESQSVAAPAPVKLVVYSRRIGCPPCVRLNSEVGSGDDDFHMEYRYEEQFPKWMQGFGTPLIYCPSTHTYIEGYVPVAEIKRRFHIVSAPQAVPALAGGTFDKAIVEKYIGYITTANIQGRLPRETLSLSGAEITLNGGAATVVHANGVATATFSAPLPEVKYGFLKIEVNSVVYNDGTLTAKLRGFPAHVTFRGR